MKFKIIQEKEKNSQDNGRVTCCLKPQKHRFIKKSKKQDANLRDTGHQQQIRKSQPKTSSMQSLLKPDYSNFVVFAQRENHQEQNMDEQPQYVLSKQASEKIAESLARKYSSNSNIDFVEFSQITQFASNSDQVENLVTIKQYFSSMFCHMRRKQMLYTPVEPQFQPLVKNNQRKMLVEWLCKICQKMSYKNQTLFTAVNIMDRFLAISRIPVNLLALLGSTVIYMATKMQEIRIPKIDTIVYISASPIVTKKSVLQLQSNIVNLLEFNLTYSSTLQFIELYCLMEGLSRQVMQHSLKIAKKSLLYGQLKRQRASVIGICCILFSINQNLKQQKGQFSHLKNLDNSIGVCMELMKKALFVEGPQ